MAPESIVPLSEYHRLPRAQHSAEFYQRQLEIVCNNATLAIFIMDEHQQCVYMNPAAEQLTGYTFAETRGRALHDVIHHTRPDGSPYPLCECPIDRAFPQNHREQGEEVFVHKDGHFYPVAYTASPIQEGATTIGTIIEVRDISQEKHNEQTRQALEQAKAEFFKNVSYEFQAPLTQMLTCLEEALTDTNDRLSPRQQERLETAKHNSHRLLKLVDTLLEFSQAEATAPHCQAPSPLPKILITNADENLQQSLQPVLSSRYQVEIAPTDGVVDVMHQSAPDLWIATEGTLTMAGIAHLRLLRADSVAQAIPLLVLVSRADGEAMSEAHHNLRTTLLTSADDCLIAPFSPSELLAKVEATLKFAKLRREATQQVQSLLLEAESAKQQVEVILSSIHDGFYALDHNWRFTFVSDRYCKMVGMTRITLLGQLIWQLFPEAVGTEAHAYFEQAMVEQKPLQFEYFYAPWQCWHEHRLYPSPSGLTVFLTDITQRKHTEAALRESEDRLRMALESARLGTWDWDLNTGELRWDAGCKSMFGLPSDAEVSIEMFYAGLHPDDRDRLEQVVQWALNPASGGRYDTEYRTVGIEDGMERWIAARGQAYFDADGQPQRFIGMVVDITARKQTDAALRLSEQRYRLLTSILTSIVWITSPTGEFVLPQLDWETYTGQTWVESQGVGWFNAIHPDHREQIRSAWLQAIGQRKLLRFEGLLWHAASQSYRHVEARGVPLFNSDGSVREWIGNVTDVHDRKQAEAELRQKNAILNVINESAPTPIFVKDRAGHIIYANPATLEVFGKPASEVIGRRDCDLYPNPEDAAQVMANDQRIMELGQTEVVEESPDGMRTFLGMKSPYRNEAGEVIGLIGISNDITERIQLERDRERILQQEQAAREAAEHANRIKDEFLAVLSHELRSPLNPILGWSKLLQTGKLDAAKTSQALGVIERNAKLQAELIEDLLDVSRILRGKLSLSITTVKLAATIRAAMETVRLAAEAKDIELQLIIHEHGESFEVAGDSARLQQVIWNLLSNAVKFTPNGGRVEVRLEPAEGRQYAQIIVTDTGKGIVPDFLPHVFDYFRQEDGATTRKFGGLGLGLAIVHHLVELHGGNVWADSPGEGQGATFTVQLPLLSRQKSFLQPIKLQSGRQCLVQTPLHGLNILIVDDDTDTREFVEFLLTQSGATVTLATTAGQAFALISEAMFDVLISDIGMPDMDGYMLIQQIRTLPTERGGQIPAIALTAYAGDFNQQQAIAAGFQFHLAKPIEPDELIRAVVTLVETHPQH
jgi:PAS domain S-box-containing protein